MTKASESFERIVKDIKNESLNEDIEYIRKVLIMFEVLLKEDRYPYKRTKTYVLDYESNISYSIITEKEAKIIKQVLRKEKGSDDKFKSYVELVKWAEKYYKR